MSRLLLDLEMDALCWEHIARRIVQLGGTPPPQPIVQYIDAPPDPEDDPDWDELTARAAAMSPLPGQETAIEMVERVLTKTGS